MSIHADAGLTSAKSPWLVGDVSWTMRLQKQAVIWLARRLKKSILRLTAKDYAEHSLQVKFWQTMGLWFPKHMQRSITTRLPQICAFIP